MESPAITAEETARIRDALLRNITPIEQPVVYAMAGIPGAGKSSFVARAQDKGLFPKTAFILNPDHVMEVLPGYQDDVNALGSDVAFGRWEMPCRALAYRLGQEAAALRLPIIKDMGMARAENWDMLADFKKHGCRIFVHHILCDVDVAVRRCATRARYFPIDQIEARAKTIDSLMKTHAGLADAIFRYDNSQTDQPYRPL